MAKTTKTTSATTAKKEAAPKKGPVAKNASTTAKKAAPTKKAATKKPAASADPAVKLEKACKDAVAKFQKMDGGQYKEIQEKLEWCIGSYNYDKNPEGLVEYGNKAANILKEVRKDSPRKVSKKLVDDLDNALAKF